VSSLSHAAGGAHLFGVYATRSDRQLLRAARTDPEAFAEFYRRHSGAVYGSIVRQVEIPEVALDVTAEAFAHALRRVGGFRGVRTDSGAAWIHAIADSLLKQYWRRQRVERSARDRLGIGEDSWSATAEDELERRLDALSQGGTLERLLDELPESQRAVVHMRVVGEASYVEIARTLGVSQETARQQAHRGLTRLRRRLELTEGAAE
jgi:RNA polymerase sigma factor (sigma-70 family)